MNTIGRMLRLTSWGESHGPALGGVLDGLPAGLALDLDAVQAEALRRAPGRSSIVSPRQEPDTIEWLSGLYQGRTLGTPIGFMVRNRNAHSHDYAHLADLYRPGHADYTYDVKYGLRDPRGGGRSSARETLVRVVAGALVRQWLRSLGIEIAAYACRIGSICLADEHPSWEQIRAHSHTRLRCPDEATELAMTQAIEQAREAGDSLGGIVCCRAQGVPVGLGEPLYDKLSARLAQAMCSINAVRGFELGDGFALSALRGSEANDAMDVDVEGRIRHLSNRAGGVLGGIASGQELVMRIAFKPTPTIALAQQTVDRSGRAVVLEASGRHDPCVVPRALAVVEAMCALVLGDFVLLDRAYHTHR